MRYKRPRVNQTRTRDVIMSGGLNLAVTPLELKPGELYESINYMETDAAFHGYSSVLGYERFDGKNKASTVGVTGLGDGGNDDNTVLLLEGEVAHVDLSTTAHDVTNTLVVRDELTTKFLGGSLKFDGAAHYSVADDSTGSFEGAYDPSFDLSTDPYPSQLDLTDYWTWDLQIRPGTRLATEVLMEKEGCYRLSIDPAGLITFETSSNGVAYTDSIAMVQLPLTGNRFTHLSIACRNFEMRMAVGGVPITTVGGNLITTTVSGFWHNTNPLIIGANAAVDSWFTGHMDEIRLSQSLRWVNEFEVPDQRYSVNEQVIRYDDIDRELQRDTILEVPGLGPVRGVHVFNGEVYALRNNSVPDGASLWKANRIDDGAGGYTQASGWVEIDDTLNIDGHLQAINYRFSGSFSDQLVMCICDGVSIPRIWDGATMHILDTSYGGGAKSDPLPDNQVSPRYAKAISVFDRRLCFGYELDDIVLSARSDPGNFSGGFGDQLQVGDDITNLRELPGEAMGIFCRNSIKILKKLETTTGQGTAPDFTFKVEEFSRQAGAFADTVERALSNIIYADDRGVVDLGATDKYGDFTAEAISKKVNRIYLDKKQRITTSLVDKANNQYRLYFNDGSGLYFTFKGEKLKGATYVEFPHSVDVACEGEDPLGELWYFFGSNDGFVYQMDSGPSFDGEAIETSLRTSYFHYGSPRYWKDFKRMVFEITAVAGTIFEVRPSYDYDDAAVQDALWYEPDLKGAGGLWGADLWGEFLWGGSIIQRIIHYIRGYGTNMSIELKTSSKYVDQHVVHNCIVDYEQGDLQE